jgi:hypothetical protein
MELEALNQDGTWRVAKKDDRFAILSKILVREGFPLVWYDEGKCLYSIALLVDFKDQYEIVVKEKTSDREQKYRLSLIKLVKSYDIQVRLADSSAIIQPFADFLGPLRFHGESNRHSPSRSHTNPRNTPETDHSHVDGLCEESVLRSTADTR